MVREGRLVRYRPNYSAYAPCACCLQPALTECLFSAQVTPHVRCGFAQIPIFFDERRCVLDIASMVIGY